MSDRVELPAVTEENVETKHISLLLIADGLKQVESNISEQETNIRKYTETLQQLHNSRIAAIAQKNLLLELQKKILELENS